MKSIRRHLTRLMAAGFSLLLVASGSAIYFLTRVALINEFDDVMRAKALTLMAQTEQSSSGLQMEDSAEITREFDNAATPQFYEIWRSNGAAFSRSKSLDGADLPRRFGSQSKPAYWNLDAPGGLAARAIGLRFQPKMDEDQRGTASAEAFLVVASDRRPLDRTLDTLALVLVATGLLAMAATVPLVRFSVRRGHAPLEELTRQAADITADSLQVRFPVDALPEELRPIIARLNDLLARLEASFERERRFSANLAHELRTPLAELRAHAEVGIRFSEGQGTESYRETLAIALQMQAIVTRLLDLARCENGKIPLQIEAVAIAPLVEEVWRPLAGQADEKQLKVRWHIPKEAEIKTDAALFRSILANLFSNAVTYTPQEGMVDIAWRMEAGELALSNTVHDLEPEDVPHLFERLWRKDKSRAGFEHHGLGLAISRAYASVLGLNLSARFTDETKLTLVLAPHKTIVDNQRSG